MKAFSFREDEESEYLLRQVELYEIAGFDCFDLQKWWFHIVQPNIWCGNYTLLGVVFQLLKMKELKGWQSSQR